PLRLPDSVLEVGDGAIHGEEIWVPLPHPAPEVGHRPPHPGTAVPTTGGAMFSTDVPQPPTQS
ncbi:MAG TPA: hypothetical protein VF221_12025, partial [Chloroflexota bacterium]